MVIALIHSVYFLCFCLNPKCFVRRAPSHSEIAVPANVSGCWWYVFILLAAFRAFFPECTVVVTCTGTVALTWTATCIS